MTITEEVHILFDNTQFTVLSPTFGMKIFTYADIITSREKRTYLYKLF